MKLRIGVLFGGASVEHEISILSAMQAMDHLDPDRYEVIPIYVAKDHCFYQDALLRDIKNFKDLDALITKLTPVTLYAKGNGAAVRKLTGLFNKEREVDLIFPIMHGTYGEDGSVQGYLRMLGIPFVGSDMAGALIGQDKVIMKQLLEGNGLPLVDWFALSRSDAQSETVLPQCEALGFPLIVKPANLGSSVGIQLVKNAEELDDALQEAFLYDDHLVIERCLSELREYNCAVLGDECHMQVSCVEEVLKGDAILSYRDKYEGNGKSKGMVSANRIIPASCSPQRQAEIEALAQKCFSVLRGSGVARIDFLLDEATDQIYVNEINTIPGSLSFYLFEQKGLTFSRLLDELINLAIERQRKQSQMIYSYPSNVLSSYSSGMKMAK